MRVGPCCRDSLTKIQNPTVVICNFLGRNSDEMGASVAGIRGKIQNATVAICNFLRRSDDEMGWPGMPGLAWKGQNATVAIQNLLRQSQSDDEMWWAGLLGLAWENAERNRCDLEFPTTARR